MECTDSNAVFGMKNVGIHELNSLFGSLKNFYLSVL